MGNMEGDATRLKEDCGPISNFFFTTSSLGNQLQWQEKVTPSTYIQIGYITYARNPTKKSVSSI